VISGNGREDLLSWKQGIEKGQKKKEATRKGEARYLNQGRLNWKKCWGPPRRDGMLGDMGKEETAPFLTNLNKKRGAPKSKKPV